MSSFNQSFPNLPEGPPADSGNNNNNNNNNNNGNSGRGIPADDPHNPGIGARRGARNPVLQAKLHQMGLTLAPLVQLTTGDVHPAFPVKLLNFWLLTDDQLESLAHFYHQRTPCRYSLQYPCPVVWRSDLPLEEKRRKIGKFIGLRGCESPVPDPDELIYHARQARLAEEEDQEMWRLKLHWYH